MEMVLTKFVSLIKEAGEVSSAREAGSGSGSSGPVTGAGASNSGVGACVSTGTGTGCSAGAGGGSTGTAGGSPEESSMVALVMTGLLSTATSVGSAGGFGLAYRAMRSGIRILQAKLTKRTKSKTICIF